MKRPIKYIFSLFFGLYFLFAGTGFNIINYCCHHCEVVGIENIALMSCHEKEHSHSNDCSHESSDDFSCSDINHHPNGCHVLRLKVEIPSVVATNISFDSVSEIQLFYFTNDLFSAFEQPEAFFAFRHSPPNYIPNSGRDILNLNAVLLI